MDDETDRETIPPHALALAAAWWCLFALLVGLALYGLLFRL